jgi:hypothetical protein
MLTEDGRPARAADAERRRPCRPARANRYRFRSRKLADRQNGNRQAAARARRTARRRSAASASLTAATAAKGIDANALADAHGNVAREVSRLRPRPRRVEHLTIKKLTACAAAQR